MADERAAMLTCSASSAHMRRNSTLHLLGRKIGTQTGATAPGFAMQHLFPEAVEGVSRPSQHLPMTHKPAHHHERAWATRKESGLHRHTWCDCFQMKRGRGGKHAWRWHEVLTSLNGMAGQDSSAWETVHTVGGVHCPAACAVCKIASPLAQSAEAGRRGVQQVLWVSLGLAERVG